MLLSPPITVGTTVDDSVITASVKPCLLAEPGIKSLEISVLTFKGEAQFTGCVNNQGQIDLATTIARAADGASGV